MSDIRRLIDAQDDAALLQLLQRKAPTGASYRTLEDFYSQQVVIARSLSLSDEMIDWLTEWRQAVPAGQSNTTATVSLWRLLARSDRLSEANALGEEIVAATSAASVSDHEYVGNASWLAGDYAAAGRLQEAEQLLQQVEPRLRRILGQSGGEDAYWRSHARTNNHTAWGYVHLGRGQIDEAVRRWKQALLEQDRQVELRHLVSPAQRESALFRAIALRLTFAGPLADVGRMFDAESLVHESQQLMVKLKVFNPFLKLRIQVTAAALSLARNDLPAARARIDRVLPEVIEREHRRMGVNTRVAVSLRMRVLLAEGDWPAIERAFEEVDRLTISNAAAAELVRLAIPRALSQAAMGRAATALPVIDRCIAQYGEALGPRHLLSVLAHGVRGIVLSSLGQERRAEAAAELLGAAKALADPSTPGRHLLAQSDWAQVRRLVLEHHIQFSASNGRHDDAFSAGEMLRDSGTQRALMVAAARTAANTRGLGEDIRRFQDADRELQALYDLLAEQSGQDARRQVPAVNARIRGRVLELETQQAAARAQIERSFPQYAKLVEPGVPTSTEIAAKLRPGEALLSLVGTSQGTWGWLIAQDGGLTARRVALSNAQAAALVSRIRASVDFDASPQLPGFDEEAARRLHDALIKPFDEALSGTRHLIVATGGVLGHLPFGLLMPPPPAAGGAGRYLIDRLAVSHVPTATAWLALQASAAGVPAPEPLMAWGDPQFNPRVPLPIERSRKLQVSRAASDPLDGTPVASVRYDQLPALPDTREELVAIAASLNADARRDLRLGAAATRASVLAASAEGELLRKRVVAFATHGLMAGDLPNLSQPALAMAATADADRDPLAPLLTLEDVLGLKLHADWVVLSACNTAAADGRAQDALSGLARGFFYAGARSLLVTHWAVETESAKLLTTRTFAHFATHPDASKAESLREAMLSLKAQSKYAHPAFWAPYALVGDGSR